MINFWTNLIGCTKTVLCCRHRKLHQKPKTGRQTSNAIDCKDRGSFAWAAEASRIHKLIGQEWELQVQSKRKDSRNKQPWEEKLEGQVRQPFLQVKSWIKRRNRSSLPVFRLSSQIEHSSSFHCGVALSVPDGTLQPLPIKYKPFTSAIPLNPQ